MSWFKRAWWRLWTWVASWFGKPPPEPPKPRWDKSAQELIDLARRVRDVRWKQIQDPKSINRITPEAYQAMMQEQVQDAPSVPSGICRSASFGVCYEQLGAGVRAKRFTLKVQK